MKIGLMVEGQNGVNWDRWLRIVKLAEDLGFPTLFRSDHYFIGSQQDSLEAFISLAVAAQQTARIRIGPLVSPVTFRSPVDVGRMAAQIDVLSGGRFVLGIGNGWNESEHSAYGIPFPPPSERSRRLEEAIQVLNAMWGPGPASFDGSYYHLDGVDPMPKPQAGRPTLLIGGSGPKRTLKLVAQYADEWNSVNGSVESFIERLDTLKRHCEAVGRDPGTIRKSIMTFGLVGPNDAAIDRAAVAAARVVGRGQMTPKELREQSKERGMISGTTDEVVDWLGRLAEAGVDEVEFQHFDFDDDSIPRYLAEEIIPRVSTL